MLRHAALQGAQVFEETKVTELEFEGCDGAAYPKAAFWMNQKGETGKIAFDYVIDASGRAGIISVKYLRNRIFNPDLKNVAIWGYWKGAGKYLPGTPRENSAFFEVLGGTNSVWDSIAVQFLPCPIDGSGWAWFIPLHDGTVSVGIVMNQERSNAKKVADREAGEDTSLVAHYLRQLPQTPSIVALLGGAKMVKKPDAPLISSASDYSYQATHYAGSRYRLVGDAGGERADLPIRAKNLFSF